MTDSPSSAAIRGILFDKDGTLIDFHKSWGPVNREAAIIASAGDEALALQLMRHGGYDPDTGITKGDSLLAAGNTSEIAAGFITAGSPIPHADLTRSIDEIFVLSNVNAVPVTDLPAFLTRLRGRGLKLGIASSDSETGIRVMAEHTGIVDLVDFIAGYDSGHGVKPGPGMVQGFCTSMGLAAHEVCVVGDNRHDMEMGINAGAGLCVSVLTGTGAREAIEPLSHHCVDSIEALEMLLTV